MLTFEIGKSLSELLQLELEIRGLMNSSDVMDPEYWAHVLKLLELEKLKTKVRSIQADVQRKALDHIQPMIKSEQVCPSHKDIRNS